MKKNREVQNNKTGKNTAGNSKSLIPKSENDLRKIFSSITELIFIIDKNGKYLNIIPTVKNGLYKPSNKLIGQKLENIFPLEQANLFNKSIKKVLQDKKPLEINYDLKIKNKTSRFISIISYLSRTTVLWIARDVTEQKLFEEKSINSLRLYKKLMEVNNDAIFIADTKTGKLLNANLTAQNLIGRSLYEIKKMHYSELHPPSYREKMKNVFQNSVKKMGQKNGKFYVLHKNGKHIPVDVSSSVIQLNGKKYIQGIFRDISKQIEIEKELISQKSFFEQLFLQSSFSTQILDKDGWCLRINPKLTELFGVRPEDIEGRKYNIFLDQSIIDNGIISHLNKVFKEGKTAEWIVNFDIAKAADSQNIQVTNRSKRWFKNKAYPILDSDGIVKNVIIQHEDITATKENDEKIKILAQSLMNITECVSITDPDDNIIFVNDAFLKTYGYTQEELIGKNISIVRPNYIPSAIIKDKISEDTNGRWKGELLNKNKEGRLFPIHLSTSVVKDENNKPIVRIGIAVDITERKKQEIALLESEEKYRLLAEASKDMIYIIDKDDKIVYLNTYAASLFRIKQEDLVGKKRSDIFHGKQNEKQYSALQKIFETKKPSYIESEIRFPDANLFIGTWLVPIPGPGGEVLSVMGVSRDITDRVLQEIQLRKFSRAVEQSPTSIVITDLEGNIEYVNPKFSQITGYSFEEIKSQNPRILKSGETPKEVYKNMWSTISAGKIWQGEFHNKKKNGDLFWEFASISPIVDKYGKIINFIAIKENITERKLAELELLAAKEKAEEMNSLKTKFLANMSHELRTPLIGVLGYAEILKEELQSDEKRLMAETIYNSGKRLLHTLNLLLDLSRIEANKEELSIKKINVGEVVRNSVKLFNPIAQSKDLTLSANILKEINANLDERIFTQIINNLLNNAIKYTDEGSINIEIDNPGNEIMLKVIDTGIGVPDDKKELIFEEFRQVSEGLSRRHQGTGLGLTIAKKYVDLLKGTITVEDNKNGGSVFIVKLPC